jgi:hypothetical protein
MRRLPWRAATLTALALLLSGAVTLPAADKPTLEYQRRVREVVSIPGLAAFWDFTLREPAAPHRFLAHRGSGTAAGWPLDAVNYVRAYWEEGREATYADLPLLGRGPFGDAVYFRDESDPNFRPTLLLPREAFHSSHLDVGGPGQSVSMAVWMIREGGNHAIAGIWHEGTDLRDRSKPAAKVQAGRRQYALFAGLAAKDGASAVHVSENGRSSFGDRYARNLATTRRLIPTVPPGASPEALDAAWSVVGFVFDNAKNTVTAYLDGEAEEFWIEDPLRHPFFQWPAKGWQQAQWNRMPGVQEGEDAGFPKDQYYDPPEGKPLQRKRVSRSDNEIVWELRFPFTRVRETWRRAASTTWDSAPPRRGNGKWELVNRELTALKANPFWFGHDLYHPATAGEGGPFTIGRVIHSSRSVGTRQYIGGVAVYHRAISTKEMRRIATIGRKGGRPAGRVLLLRAEALNTPR